MLEIAVCDDIRETAEFLSGRLRQEFSDCGEAVHVSVFTDCGQLLHSYLPKKYRAIFLDIDMPEISGIKAAGEIAGQDENQPVIFITNRDDLVHEALTAYPFGCFVRKSFLEKELPPVIRQLCRNIKRDKQEFVFQTRHAVYRVCFRDIIYFESCQHIVTLHHTKGVHIVPKSLSQIETELSPYGFIRIHSGYLVNCRYIFSIENNHVLLDSREELPLSRHRTKTVKKTFLKNMGDLL